MDHFNEARKCSVQLTTSNSEFKTTNIGRPETMNETRTTAAEFGVNCSNYRYHSLNGDLEGKVRSTKSF